MFRRSIWIVIIAATHFALGRLIIPLVTNRLMAVTDSNPAVTWGIQLLIWTTRVLYFPIISLSLYSRKWFPGEWIYIPIIINSLLWGILVCAVLMAIKKIRR
jgi:hypothetical protein